MPNSPFSHQLFPSLGFDPLRACRICQHRDRVASTPDEPLCRHPRVTGRPGALHCTAARRPGGACGPEARLLEFPGLHERRTA